MRPGFAGVVIATLALGLGATIGIFSVANAVLFLPRARYLPAHRA
jgi:hypothetical protein